jgi:glutamate N-acetyltransferase / amino-acid N-acetyltransferase
MSITAPQGFAAAGVHAGIRREKKDLALVRTLGEGTGAAMWTRNRVLAAPVVVSQEHLACAQPQAVAINSGVANAATGEQGIADARATAEHAASLLGLVPEQVLVLSTGVIGAPLPLALVTAGLEAAAAALSPDGGADAAEAILTTDTRAKQAVSYGPGFTVGGMAKGSGMIHPNLATMLAVVTTDYPLLAGEAILTTDTRAKQAVSYGPGFTVGGMAKGSGMIHPNLATMLAVVTTDYPLLAGEAIDFLRPAVEQSFNSISVDGECSTNDAVVLLSSDAARIERTPASDESFSRALHAVCADLAHQIVEDGEGATLLAEIAVSGAASGGEAKAIAQRIATSSLVKTALFGRDANWGRVLAAAGSAPWNGGYAQLDPALVSLTYNGTPVLVAGTPQNAEPSVEGAVCSIELDLGLGDGSAAYLTSDLSYDYVRINADYRS